MKKQFMLCVGILLAALFVVSCSNNATENQPAATQAVTPVTPVAKTAKMLSFETALKDWMQSKNQSKNAVLNTDRIVTKSLDLLQEIGVNPNEINRRRINANDELVLFTMDEYSKKLRAMYNQNKQ